MWNVSTCMKVLKQRFSQWFNGHYAGRGTLWEDRYRCYFSDGAVIGGKAFVDEMFAGFRDRFGPKRNHGARPLQTMCQAFSRGI